MATLNEIHPPADFLKEREGAFAAVEQDPPAGNVDDERQAGGRGAGRSFISAFARFRGAGQAIAGIKLGLESLARGEGVPAKTVFAQLRRKHKIPASE